MQDLEPTHNRVAFATRLFFISPKSVVEPSESIDTKSET